MGPALPACKHSGLNNASSWIGEEFKRGGLAKAQGRQANGKDECLAFKALLRACSKSKDLYTCNRLFDSSVRRGLLSNCSDALITMYAKCGAVAQAKQLLDVHNSKDASTWTAIIVGYVQKGQGQNALDMFERMKCEGLSADAMTYSCIFKACGSIRALEKGKNIHDEIVQRGFLGSNIVLSNALVNMYAKCGALAKARQVLEELPARNVITWTALMAGYIDHDEGEQALTCLDRMQQEGLSANAVTFLCALKACGIIGDVDEGEKIHDEIVNQGLLLSNVMLGTALVDMYAKCGALVKARQVLEQLRVRNAITWNALLRGYIEHGQDEQALDCFDQIQREGISPDSVTYCCMFKACGHVRAADKGEEFHNEAVFQGLLQNDIVLGNALVDMYAKCGALVKAQHVLEELSVRNVISWNALIAGYSEHGESEKALDSFGRMQDEGLSPNAVTFACILRACGSLGLAEKGARFHEEIFKQGLLRDNIVLGAALVDMYAKCNTLAKARRVLEELPIWDVVSWTALIAGYTEHGEGEQALMCFEEMQSKGLSPNAITFACILKTCGNIGAAAKGERYHHEIAKLGLSLSEETMLSSALVVMYARCGVLIRARQILEELSVRDVISWTALMTGFVEHGDGVQAINSFKEMECEGISPDAATLSCVLGACSQLGQVEDAQRYFVELSTKYGLKPDLEHYTCMVDLFGRTGHLDRAVGIIEGMPSFDGAVWSAVLGACQKWGDAKVGRWVFEHAER